MPDSEGDGVIGVPQQYPASTRPDWSTWSLGYLENYRTNPAFVRRTNLFLSSLLNLLDSFPSFVAQPLYPNEFPSVQGVERTAYGLHMHIVGQPMRPSRRKQLFVVIDIHTSTTGPAFGLGPSARKHCSYYRAWDAESLVRNNGMHWKNCDAAIAGITEWVLGSIYIPGPE